MFFAMDPADLRQITQAIRDGFKDVQFSYGGGSGSGSGSGSRRRKEKVDDSGGTGDITDDAKKEGAGLFDFWEQKAQGIGTAIKQIYESNKIGSKEIADAFEEQQEYAQGIYKAFGLTRTYTSEISKSFGEAKYTIKEMGGDLKDSYDLLEEISKATARNSLASAESVDDLYALSKILPNINTGNLVQNFEQVGIGVNRLGKETMGVVENASSLGLNVGKVSELFVRNLEKANAYNFQSGVQGLARMAATATMFKMDMSATLSLADKLLSPENAIEMAAGLQRLGVASSDLIDPLRLMDLAQNDPEELQKQVIDLAKQFTYFDEKTKTIKILPDAQRTLREVAPLIGMNTQELANLAIQSGVVEDKMSKISFPSMNIDEKDKMMLANLAEMNESGTDYVVKFQDEKGTLITKALDQLTEKDLERIKLEQDKAAKLQDPVEMAKAQMTVLDRLSNALNKFEGRIPTEIASSETVEQGGEMILKTGEVMVGTAEKILNKAGEKLLGEGKGIADAIDENVKKYFKDGKLDMTGLEKDFGIAQQKASELAEKISNLNFESIITEGKETFKKIGEISTTAFKESILEVMKTTTPGVVQEGLKSMLTQAEITLSELAKGKSSETEKIPTSEKPTGGEKVEFNNEKIAREDTIIYNTIVTLDKKDSIDITERGIAAGTDLYGLKERFAEFQETMIGGLESIFKTQNPTSVGFKVEDVAAQIRLVLEKSSLDVLSQEMEKLLPKEKNVEYKPKTEELEKASEKASQTIEKTIKLKPEEFKFETNVDQTKLEESIITPIKDFEKNLKTEYIFNFTDKGSIKIVNTDLDLLHKNFDKLNELAKNFKLSNNFDEVTKQFDGIVQNLKTQNPELNLQTDKLDNATKKYKDLSENIISLNTVTLNPNVEIPKEKLDLFHKEIANIREGLEKNYGTTGFEKALEEAQKKFESLKTETFKISPQIEADYSKVSKFEILTDETQMKEFKATIDELYKPRKVNVETDEEKFKELEDKLNHVRNFYIHAKPLLPKEKLEEFEKEFQNIKTNIKVESNVEDLEKQIKDFFIETSEGSNKAREELNKLTKSTIESSDAIKTLGFEKITGFGDIMKLNPELTKKQAQDIFNEIQEVHKNITKNISVNDLNSLEETKKALESRAQDLDKSLGDIIKKHNLKIDVDYQTNQESILNVNKITDQFKKPVETQVNYTPVDIKAKEALDEIPKEKNVSVNLTTGSNVIETQDTVSKLVDQTKNLENKPFELKFTTNDDLTLKYMEELQTQINGFQKQVNSTTFQNLITEDQKTNFNKDLKNIGDMFKTAMSSPDVDYHQVTEKLEEVVKKYNEINLKFVANEESKQLIEKETKNLVRDETKNVNVVANVNEQTKQAFEQVTKTSDKTVNIKTEEPSIESKIKFIPPKQDEVAKNLEIYEDELKKLELAPKIKFTPPNSKDLIGDFENEYTEELKKLEKKGNETIFKPNVKIDQNSKDFMLGFENEYTEELKKLEKKGNETIFKPTLQIDQNSKDIQFENLLKDINNFTKIVMSPELNLSENQKEKFKKDLDKLYDKKIPLLTEIDERSMSQAEKSFEKLKEKYSKYTTDVNTKINEESLNNTEKTIQDRTKISDKEFKIVPKFDEMEKGIEEKTSTPSIKYVDMIPKVDELQTFTEDYQNKGIDVKINPDTSELKKIKNSAVFSEMKIDKKSKDEELQNLLKEINNFTKIVMSPEMNISEEQKEKFKKDLDKLYDRKIPLSTELDERSLNNAEFAFDKLKDKYSKLFSDDEKPLVKKVNIDDEDAKKSLTSLGTTDFGIKLLSSPLQDYIKSLQSNSIKIPIDADTTNIQKEVEMKVKPTIETESVIKGTEPMRENKNFVPISSVNLPEIIIQETKPENLMTKMPMIEAKPFELPKVEPQIKVETPESITAPINRMENINTTTTTSNVKVEGTANMNHTVNFSGVPPGVDPTMFKNMMVDYMNNPENAKKLARSITDMSSGYGTNSLMSVPGMDNKNMG